MKQQRLENLLHSAEQHVPPAAIVIAGVILAFAAALAPHHAHAIQMLPLQAVVGLLPYALYGVIAALLRAPVVVRAGLLVLGVHLLAVLLQRALSPAEGSGPIAVIVPLLLALGLLSLWPRALRESDPSGRRD
jgi:hypothetical protein